MFRSSSQLPRSTHTCRDGSTSSPLPITNRPSGLLSADFTPHTLHSHDHTHNCGAGVARSQATRTHLARESRRLAVVHNSLRNITRLVPGPQIINVLSIHVRRASCTADPGIRFMRICRSAREMPLRNFEVELASRPSILKLPNSQPRFWSALFSART